jgi:hypothetical protein
MELPESVVHALQWVFCAVMEGAVMESAVVTFTRLRIYALNLEHVRTKIKYAS